MLRTRFPSSRNASHMAGGRPDRSDMLGGEGELTERRLRRGVFTSVPDLINAIET